MKMTINEIVKACGWVESESNPMQNLDRNRPIDSTEIVGKSSDGRVVYVLRDGYSNTRVIVRWPVSAGV